MYFSCSQKLPCCQSKNFRENVVSLRGHCSEAKPTKTCDTISQEVAGSNSVRGVECKADARKRGDCKYTPGMECLQEERDGQENRVLLKVCCCRLLLVVNHGRQSSEATTEADSVSQMTSWFYSAPFGEHVNLAYKFFWQRGDPQLVAVRTIPVFTAVSVSVQDREKINKNTCLYIQGVKAWW